MRTRPLVALLFVTVAASACRTSRNYPELEGPRYIGGPTARLDDDRRSTDTLRVVSFNIAFARHVDRAIAVLDSEPALRHADVVFLQEMDADGTQRVAEALRMWYVFYPAVLHSRTRRDFGNAVLSRWPIVDDAKVVLPHRSWYAGTQRTATAATIRVGESRVRLYSTHLSTLLDMRTGGRLDQLRAIIEDARPYSHVVIGGDMNTAAVGAVAREQGYSWPTEHGPNTTLGGRWDHIFLKGLRVSDSAGAGTALDARGASDHRPVWAVGVFR